MGFLSSVFTGDNPTLDKLNSTFGNIGGTATKTGTNDVSTASDFFNSILSGGGGKYLAPQITAIQNQGSQKLNTLSQFGNRSGGTNASAQMVGDSTRSGVNDLFANLSGTAATGLAGIGENEQQLGLSSFGQQANIAQMQQQNQQNSILGKGIGAAVGAAESFGLGGAFNAISPTLFGKMSGSTNGASTGSNSPWSVSNLMKGFSL